MATPQNPIPSPTAGELQVRNLGSQPYRRVFEAMKAFTDNRHPDSADEIWLLQHQPVFTQGQAGKAEHVLAPGDIPVVQVDRGGQVTYHGPGQVVAYLMLDIRRLGIGVKGLVTAIEQAIVGLLGEYGIEAGSRPGAPGVYVGEQKIASLGIRVRRGCSYHGLSLNVDMDLSPYQRINPCGYRGLMMTQLKDLLPPGRTVSLDLVEESLVARLAGELGYTGWWSRENPEDILSSWT